MRIDSAVSNISLYLPLNLFQVFRWKSAKLLLSPCSCAAAPNFAPKKSKFREKKVDSWYGYTEAFKIAHAR